MTLTGNQLSQEYFIRYYVNDQLLLLSYKEIISCFSQFIPCAFIAWNVNENWMNKFVTKMKFIKEFIRIYTYLIKILVFKIRIYGTADISTHTHIFSFFYNSSHYHESLKINEAYIIFATRSLIMKTTWKELNVKIFCYTYYLKDI